MSRKNWTSEKIFSRLLNNKTKRTYWDNISELRSRPNNEVYNQAFNWAKSTVYKQKIIGINVLTQLGYDPRLHKARTVKLFFDLLEQEENPLVIQALLFGIGHNNENLVASQIELLATFKHNTSLAIREGLTFALLGLENDIAIRTLINLSSDRFSAIRNWATFGIGNMIEESNQAIKSALWARIKDKHQETRFEAILGLAKRGDIRIKDVILEELEKDEYESILFEAIEHFPDKDYTSLLESNLKAAKNNSLAEVWIQRLEDCIKKVKN